MLKTFHIEKRTNAEDGVTAYVARLDSDFDESGIPLPNAPQGAGESVWEAIERLCAVLVDSDSD